MAKNELPGTNLFKTIGTAQATAKGVAKAAFPKLSMAAKAAERPITKAYQKAVVNRLTRGEGKSGKLKADK